MARKLAADSSEPAAPSASTAGQAEAEAPVRVFARFRPMNRKELDMKAEQCVQLDQNGTNVEVVAKSASGASKYVSFWDVSASCRSDTEALQRQPPV